MSMWQESNAIASLLSAGVDFWKPDQAPLAAPANFSGSCHPGSLRLPFHANESCPGNRCSVPHPLCLAQRGEYVSDMIRRHGYWPDCKWLIGMWDSLEAVQVDGRDMGDLFVDVGANIGGCTLEMLLRTDARVVAFEPSPSNLFYLTRTLHRAAELDPTIVHRVVVLPYAAGSSSETRQINDNGGASAIVPVSSTAAASCLAQRNCGGSVQSIQQRTLDELLEHFWDTHGQKKVNPDTVPVRVMKIDVQGYECSVLEGALRSLKSHMVASISAEWDAKTNPGRSFRCTQRRLFEAFHTGGLGYVKIHTMSEETIFAHRCGQLDMHHVDGRLRTHSDFFTKPTGACKFV